MKQSFTRKEFKNDLEKWLNSNTTLNFKGKILDGYQIVLTAKIPSKTTDDVLRKLDYFAYKSFFAEKLVTKNQFSFNIYINKEYKFMSIWITSLNNKISKFQLDKCKRTIKRFFNSY